MGTPAKPAPFLLRDKIRLFDRFAIDASPLNTSRSLRDDQTTNDTAMFPGWKHVPKPSPPPPLLLHKRSKHEPIASLGINAEPLMSPRIVLKDTDLEPVEDTIRKIMDDAIDANTHALTARFQAVLKQQCNFIEHKHQVLVGQYRQRVNKAMMAAQAKLERCRAELAETRKVAQSASKVAEERDHLRSENDNLKTEIASISGQLKQEKIAMNTKVKFLRALIAENARSKPDAKTFPTQKRISAVRPEPSTEDRTTATANRERSQEALIQEHSQQAPNQQKSEDTLKASDQDRLQKQLLSQQQDHHQKKPEQQLVQQQQQLQQIEPHNEQKTLSQGSDAQEGIENDNNEQEDRIDVTKLVEELEGKQEELTKLAKEKKSVEQRYKKVKEENAKLKTELDQQKSILVFERERLTQKNAQANTEIRDLIVKLDDASSRVEQLVQKDQEMETTLKETQESLAQLTAEKLHSEETTRKKIEQLESALKRTRRVMCIRSLLFQAHLKTIGLSVVVCDKIDEYLDIQLTCKQCLGILRKPQVLYPCGHSFCEPCIENLRDPESKRLVCCDCENECEAITVTNSAIDAIISQYNWWKVSLDDLRKKYDGARGSLQGDNNLDPDFAVALSASANQTNPVLRPSLARLSRQYSKQK